MPPPACRRLYSSAFRASFGGKGVCRRVCAEQLAPHVLQHEPGHGKVIFQRDIGIQEKGAVQVRLGQYGDICIAAETHAKGFQLAARAVPVQRLPQQELEQQVPHYGGALGLDDALQLGA